MARFNYLIPNPLETKLKKQMQLKVATLLSASSLAYFFHPASSAMVAFGIYWAIPNGSPIVKAGAEGERRALGNHKQPFKGSLAELSDQYTVFNNLVIPFKNSTREIVPLTLLAHTIQTFQPPFRAKNPGSPTHLLRHWTALMLKHRTEQGLFGTKKPYAWFSNEIAPPVRKYHMIDQIKQTDKPQLRGRRPLGAQATRIEKE